MLTNSTSPPPVVDHQFPKSFETKSSISCAKASRFSGGPPLYFFRTVRSSETPSVQIFGKWQFDRRDILKIHIDHPEPASSVRRPLTAMSPVDQKQAAWHASTYAVAALCGVEGRFLRSVLTAHGLNPHPQIAALASFGGGH